MKIYTTNNLLKLLLLIGLTGCILKPDSDISSEIVVNNDEQSLSQRLQSHDQEVEIDTSLNESLPKVFMLANRNFDLRLIAEVQSPTVGSVKTQATMVSIPAGSNRAAVSYNESGPGYAGALDILQLPSGNNAQLRMRSGVQFSDADVNAVHLNDTRIWSAQSSNNPKLVNAGEFSATRQFTLSGFNISPNSVVQASMPGFAANSIREFDGRVYITSGDNAGLSVFDLTLAEKIAFVQIPDARWVDVDANRVLVLSSGTIHVLHPKSLDVLNTYSFPGADTPEAKNTVEIVGNLALIAAGKSGAHIMDLTNGNILATIPIPDPVKLGLSPDVVETNAVSADEEYIFIANGEAGVYVAIASANLNQYQSGQPLTVQILGQLKFDNLQSVNHVVFRDRNLIVASGLGGIKAVRLTK